MSIWPYHNSQSEQEKYLEKERDELFRPLGKLYAENEFLNKLMGTSKKPV